MGMDIFTGRARRNETPMVKQEYEKANQHQEEDQITATWTIDSEKLCKSFLGRNYDIRKGHFMKMDYDFYNATLLLLTTISIFFQCYVVFMVIRASPKSMSEYRYFLCLISIWDLLFTILLGYGLHPKLLLPLSAGEIKGLFKYFGLLGAKVGV
ncbi:serpentine type 7TM GPCR chemoreceptor srh domain-containing protein [Ditylenchus destructor]|uniref:Serpentine type 7TM GPCR chemoreceptor srh domain-containing protein n=1 Tax=Ditylenchus destructor TaxID=166010 RepID=A0AAD4MJQ1_9BILA|nr:serpentine type 7TM GPCR chemoreceptor srh domain-containing protein [Ditylenchus destructor]